MKCVVVYSRGTDGHRAEYNLLLEKELCGLGVVPEFVTRRSARLLTKTVFFTMIEEDLPMFLLCALAECHHWIVFSGGRMFSKE